MHSRSRTSADPREAQAEQEPARVEHTEATDAHAPVLIASTERPTIGLASRRLSRLPGISAFLGADTVFLRRMTTPLGRRNVDSCDKIAGWGRKPTSVKARRAAEAAGIPFLFLEDGFLRSVGSGAEDPPLSIVIDELGIYYDATAPSMLESLIATPLTERQAERARRLMAAWREARVSKYNKARDFQGALPDRFVLVVDQTFGDDSVRYGLADGSSFQRMLDAAISENPNSTILVKSHPDFWSGRKKGNFNLRRIRQLPRVQVLVADCHAASLIGKAEAVYTVSSQMGFEALIWGKPVHCFGVPFYAGWGLTTDTVDTPERRGRASMEQLVHAALIAYPRYLDPETGKSCEAEAIVEHLALQRRMRARFPEKMYAIGFSVWKRQAFNEFMAGSDVRYPKKNRRVVPKGATVAIWGNTPRDDVPRDSPLIRVEDGFLRSVGLGAERRRPMSLALDPVGIYYDSSRPSALENILGSTWFDRTLVERAARLRERLIAEQLSKYNLQAAPWKRPDTSSPVVLVPGQVESDASIQFGAPGVNRNIDLLAAVRARRPDAYIVYKPHPDVVAGLREQGEREHRAAELCDEIVTSAPVAQMLHEADEVHLLTSLTGFEALIRGKSVTCYGQPFYAGWGLTEDLLPVARRARRLTLDELVAGCLILYPTYVSWKSGRFISAEQAVESLVAWRDSGEGAVLASHKAVRLAARLERFYFSTLARMRAGR